MMRQSDISILHQTDLSDSMLGFHCRYLNKLRSYEYGRLEAFHGFVFMFVDMMNTSMTVYHLAILLLPSLLQKKTSEYFNKGGSTK